MRTIGFILIIFCIISILLLIIGLQVPIISLIDEMGVGLGILFRIILLLIGVMLMSAKKERLPEERFPELKELNKIDNSGAASTSGTDTNPA